MKANLIVLKLGVKRINRFYIELPYCIIRVSKSIKEHHTHHLFKMILDLNFNFLFTTIQRTRDSKEERKKSFKP